MLRVRAKLHSWMERGTLALRWLRGDDAEQWRSCERIIFVCSGNICRSAYAQAAAKMHGMAAVSCGTHTENGLPANATAISEAAHRGVDLNSHRTTRWRDIEVRKGDVIVAMQLRHAIEVLPRAFAYACRVVVLGSLLLPKHATISDPYGKPAHEFQRVFGIIDAGLERLAQLRSVATGQDK